MKCVQALRDSKTTKAGDIVRIKDAEAASRVDNRYWKYVSKGEWKKATRTQQTENKSK